MLCLLSQNNLRPVINAQWHTPCIQAIVFFYFTIILLTFLSDKIPGTTLFCIYISELHKFVYLITFNLRCWADVSETS